MEPKEPVSPDPKTPPANPGDTPPAPAPAVPVAPAPADLKPAPAPAPKDPTSKLQGQRDKLQNQVSQLEAFLEPIAVERAVDSFLAQHKDTYPDVTRDDLLDVPSISEESLTHYAARMQKRLQEHAQAAVHKIESPTAPVISVTERDAQLKQLKESKEPGRFARMLELKRLPFAK